MIKVTEKTELSLAVGGVKSLNVPAVKKIMEHRLTFPPMVSKKKCIECQMLMGIPDHYKWVFDTGLYCSPDLWLCLLRLYCSQIYDCVLRLYCSQIFEFLLRLYILRSLTVWWDYTVHRSATDVWQFTVHRAMTTVCWHYFVLTFDLFVVVDFSVLTFYCFFLLLTASCCLSTLYSSQIYDFLDTVLLMCLRLNIISEEHSMVLPEIQKGL